MGTSFEEIDRAASTIEATDLAIKGEFSPSIFTETEEGRIGGTIVKTLRIVPSKADGPSDEALTYLFRADDNSNFLNDTESILPLKIAARAQSEENSNHFYHNRLSNMLVK